MVCYLGLWDCIHDKDNNTHNLKSYHANSIICDIHNKTIEYFEPESNDSVFNELTDLILSSEFNKILPDWTFKNVFKNKTGLQAHMRLKCPVTKTTDWHNDLCVTWSTLYLILRIINPDKTPENILDELLSLKPNELKNKLLRFQKYIISILQDYKRIHIEDYIKSEIED